MEVKKIEWSEYIELVTKLGDKLEEHKDDFYGIFGIPRGGLIPAVMLSHRLDKPLIDWSFILDSFNGNGKRMLLVDDVADKGKTIMRYVARGRRSFIIATLHKKVSSVVTPHYSVELVPDDVWLTYPYEQEIKEGLDKK